MCQYYHWQCHQCAGTNDVVVRCKTNLQQQRRDPCARGHTLPLPPDAPKLECQQCLHYRPPGAAQHIPPRERTTGHHGLDGPFRRLSLQTSGALPVTSAQTAAQVVDYPSEYDVFWLNPVLRLPEPSAKLSEYGEQRAKVFHVAAEEKKSKKQEPDRNVAWEESWSELQKTLHTV